MSKFIPTLVGAGLALAIAGAYAKDSSKDPDDQDWQPAATEKGPYTNDKAGPDQTAKPGRAADQGSTPTMQPSPSDQTGQSEQKQAPEQRSGQAGSASNQRPTN